jgi:hypothetical protein
MRRNTWVTTYRLLWRVLAGLAGVVGLLVGLFFVPGDLMFRLLFVAALIGSTAGSIAWSKAEGTATPARARRSAAIAATVIAAVVACTGYVVLFGPVGPAVVVVLGLTSPPLMRRCGLRLGHIPGRRYRRGALSTAELCRQWRDSYEALRYATTATARLRIVEARQHYLDELERRDPLGLRAWLGENASPAGDPSRFLAGEESGDSR